jgi:uncharacterized protein
MIKIGLLSDTHGYLDPKIFEYFKGCDELWHAGDIGSTELADALKKFKPLRAVFGNIDDISLQTRYPEDLIFNCEQVKVWITHIGGAPPNYNPNVRKRLTQDPPNLFICGHSHILRIKRDPNFDHMLYLNPGAAGNQGFHAMKTIVRFTVNGSKIEQLEVVELGKRGALV